MRFINFCLAAVVILLCVNHTKAQTIFYPNNSSQLLKATAMDMAMLLNQATTPNQFNTALYTTPPSSGIVFIYDSTIIGNQTCVVKKTNSSTLTFRATQDNGLVYGIYQYLNTLGFKFYAPGSLWQVTPSIANTLINIDTTYKGNYKYQTWFISGGYNRWIMDNNANYGWDRYYGENGHAWALYQRRNGMLGEYAFAGHRGDIMAGDYLNTLKNNPCYVAAYNGERVANPQSVPDINNATAVDLWGNAIEKNYTQYKNIINNNPILYANQFRNFNYGSTNIGIEVPDAAQWGNSSSINSCGSNNYPSISDQQFTLANETAKQINSIYPNKIFQVYAYSTHANVPSTNINLNENIDVQLIPEVYQMETSTNGLRNRWYNRHKNLSEYNYLNLSGWSGENPNFSWEELNTTLKLAKEKKMQGLVWEASPSKFASLPYLLAANNFLKDGKSVEATLQEYTQAMYGNAASTIYNMLKEWGSNANALSKYTMQMYMELLNKANTQTQNDNAAVKNRIKELKAYFHYMMLYYDVANNDGDKTKSKLQKDAVICTYIAKINKLQLLNGYYLISTFTSKYNTQSDFYKMYNSANGSAYNGGNLTPITDDEIEQNFLNDLNSFNYKISNFESIDEEEIVKAIEQNELTSLPIIKTHLIYTNGLDYYNKTTFNIYAKNKGNFTIAYTPKFNDNKKGYINFLIESIDNAGVVIKDVTLNNTTKNGELAIQLPSAGKYLLTIVTKYKTELTLEINTNKNYFYKKGQFLGNKTEQYNIDNNSLPGYFYLPNNISKLYFNSPNNYTGVKFSLAEELSSTFNFIDNNSQKVKLQLVTPKDSSLFYMAIPQQAQGNFFRATNMAQYNLQMVNAPNYLWYLTKKNNQKSDAVTPNNLQQAFLSMYPNPSKGNYNLLHNSKNITAETIVVYNSQGNAVANFNNISSFSISNLPSGIYFYTATVNGEKFSGRLMKL